MTETKTTQVCAEEKKKKKPDWHTITLYQATGGDVTVHAAECSIPVTTEEIESIFKILHAQLKKLGWIDETRLCVYMWVADKQTHSVITSANTSLADRLDELIKDNRRTKQVVIEILTQASSAPMRTIIAKPTKNGPFELSAHLRKNDLTPVFQRLMAT
ncbi:MAG: hypothetical protein KGL39_01490 [Patescibacteria group bacterium]|nr:hypothetical protein [Patescibacteria group bacterium]